MSINDIKLNLSIKDIIGYSVVLSTIITMWLTLKAEVASAKELPKPIIDRVEYDLRHEMIHQNMEEIREDLIEIKLLIIKLDKRIYEDSRKNK